MLLVTGSCQTPDKLASSVGRLLLFLSSLCTTCSYRLCLSAHPVAWRASVHCCFSLLRSAACSRFLWRTCSIVQDAFFLFSVCLVCLLVRLASVLFQSVVVLISFMCLVQSTPHLLFVASTAFLSIFLLLLIHHTYSHDQISSSWLSVLQFIMAGRSSSCRSLLPRPARLVLFAVFVYPGSSFLCGVRRAVSTIAVCIFSGSPYI
jgi:hypothetical protein